MLNHYYDIWYLLPGCSCPNCSSMRQNLWFILSVYQQQWGNSVCSNWDEYTRLRFQRTKARANQMKPRYIFPWRPLPSKITRTNVPFPLEFGGILGSCPNCSPMRQNLWFILSVYQQQWGNSVCFNWDEYTRLRFQRTKARANQMKPDIFSLAATALKNYTYQCSISARVWGHPWYTQNMKSMYGSLLKSQ